MTGHDIELRLPSLLARLAEEAMTQTDEATQLIRFQTRMRSSRRRTLLAAAAAAVVVGAGVTGTVMTLGNTSGERVTTPGASQAPAPALPAGVQEGVYERGVGTQVARLTLSASAVTFADSRGATHEGVRVEQPDVLVFQPDDFLCAAPGRYRVTSGVAGLAFVALADTCGDRKAFLTGGPFTLRP
ncbi:MAG TPA: hypothetical protein VM097_00945 [Mycobacteriales bacterium]|nr:hypothetical protein [Mycobacteriales bacterium]